MVDPVQKPRMHKTPIHEPALPWIRRNIPKLPLKILRVANPMLVESLLPDLPWKLLAHFMGKAAFDALSATLDRLAFCRRQQDV